MPFPWMQTLSARISQTVLPEMCGETLWISSDYSFGNPASQYDVVGLLLATPESSFGWEERRKHARSKYLRDKRRMAWKRMSDSRRQDAFFPFLHAADHIDGLCVTIAFDRDPVFRISTPEILAQYHGRSWLTANWNPETFEQAIRIASLTALFVAGLSSPGQNVLWISDQDAVFANETFHRDTGALFTRLLSAFSSHAFGQISIGTTAMTESDLLEEDLASIPDLMVGATCEVLTCIRRKFRHVPRIIVDMPHLSARAGNFVQWLRDENQPLKRRMCVLERCSDRGFSVGVLGFN
jgi:hypothetical protein